MRKRHPKIKINCLNCGKEVYVWYSRIKIGKGKFCSTSCGKVGIFNYAWKGGIKYIDGYRFLLVKDHPRTNKKGYVREHHLVMEQFIGRTLLEREVVHHINGVRSDNRIENLKLCKDQAEHMDIHREKRGRFISFLNI